MVRPLAQSFLVYFLEKICVVPMWHAFAFLSGLSATLKLAGIRGQKTQLTDCSSHARSRRRV
jgi:hypothetical protein